MGKKLLGFFKSTAGMVLIVALLAGLIVHIITYVKSGVGNFYTPYNMSTLTRSASFIILVGFGQTLVLLTGGIDLSVASVGSVCSMISAQLMVNAGVEAYTAILFSCLLGLALGAINGFFIAYLQITPFIVTLATGEIFKGIVYVVTKGMPITGVPKKASSLANGIIGGVIPNILIIMLIICALLTLMLKKTSFGRHIYALGGNRNCARIVGIRTQRVEMAVYCLSGMMAAIAGVMMTCRLESFQASIGENWVMPSVTASVLGGTSMLGGIGGVIGTVVGGFFSSVISTSITLLRVSSYWETIVTGGVVLIAVVMDAFKENANLRESISRYFRSHFGGKQQQSLNQENEAG